MMQSRKVSTSKSGKASSMLMLALLVFVMRNPLAPSDAVAATSIAADNDNATVVEDGTIKVAAKDGFLARKIAPAGATLEVQSFRIGRDMRLANSMLPNHTYGAVQINADGSYSFTPARGFVGQVNGTITIKRSDGQIDTSKFSIAVTPAAITVNDDRGPASVTHVLDGILANDTVPDGEKLFVDSVSFGGQTVKAGQAATLNGVGTLVVNQDGTYNFAAENGYTGAVPVATITVRDTSGVTATEHLTIDLNPPAPKPFNHDGGMYNTAAQFKAIAGQVAQAGTIQSTDFADIRKSKIDSVDYTAHATSTLGPLQGPGQKDDYAAYTLAVDWQITGDRAHSDAAVRILNAWANTLKTINTSNGQSYLWAGYQGYQLVSAAETLRNYSGWSATDQAAFRNMLLNVFVPVVRGKLANIAEGKAGDIANWNQGTIACLMAIGIYTDRRNLYEEAKNAYLHGRTGGAILNATPYAYPDGTVQWQESGRDQAHTSMGIGAATYICQMAWQQGDDLFGAYNNRLLAAAEYFTKYNVGEDVNYTPYIFGGTRWYLNIGSYHRNPFFDSWFPMLYTHYVHVKGIRSPLLDLALPYSRSVGGDSNLPWGRLTGTAPALTGLADDKAAVVQGGTLSAAAAHGLLANDHGPAGDKLTVTQFSVGGVTAPAGKAAVITGVGSLTVNADGSYAFKPVAGFTGAVPAVTVTVSEAFGVTATETLLITVTP